MIKFEYAHSKKSLKDQWILTGKTPNRVSALDIDETTLAPEQRTVIAPFLGNYHPIQKYWYIKLETYSHKPGDRGVGADLMEFDAPPTLDEILPLLPQMAEQHRQAIATADEAQKKYQQEQAEKIAREKAEWLKREEAKERDQAAAEAIKQQRLTERTAWIDQHGSIRLKKCIEKGYDCTRLYWIERTALDYPDTVLDYNDSAAWNERKGPSLDALNKLEALESLYPNDEIEIVWLTSPATNQPDEDADPEFEAHEAIAIKPATYEGRWLVMDL